MGAEMHGTPVPCTLVPYLGKAPLYSSQESNTMLSCDERRGVMKVQGSLHKNSSTGVL